MTSPPHWLLLRGLARQRVHWYGFDDTFARALDVSVSTLDLPGVGSSRQPRFPSSVRDAMRLLRAEWQSARREADGPWGLLGISLGGMVALAWLEAFPEDFARAVVINTSARDVARPWERFSWRTAAAVPRVLRERDPVRREEAILGLVSAHVSAERRRELAQHAARAIARPVTFADAARQVAAASRFRAPHALAVPPLFLSSRGDALADPRCSARLAARYGAVLATHPSAGHDLPLDDPQWVIDRVRG